MSPESEIPRPPAQRRLNGRIALIVVGAIAFFVLIFGRGIASFWIDLLWHRALGRSDIFWGQLTAKLTMFGVCLLVFLLLGWVNLWVADRTAPVRLENNVPPVVQRFHEVFGRRMRLVRYGVAALLGILVSLPATQQWEDLLLFRNSQTFGVTDPQFGADVGFYVFRLPLVSFLSDWLFAALLLIIIITAITHILNGAVLFAGMVPTVRQATKVHMAVLLAILAVLRAGDYWLARFDLTNETRGVVQGATYAVVNAELPALMLLTLIALLTAVLFLVTIRTDRWRFPLIASVLWLVVSIGGGSVYPSLIQSLVVRPNQAERELPYIARNVDATRAAMALDSVATEPIQFNALSAADIESDPQPFENVRLLSPGLMLSRFAIDRGEVAGLQVDDLDVDRYELDGEREQVLVAARELDLDGIPNQSWQGRHLVSTRGCGLVMAPVSQVTSSLRPDYITVDLDRPELYFSPSMTDYAVANTSVTESGCGDSGDYSGTSGIEMSGIFRRAVTALSFLDYNLLASGAVNSDSQLLLIRDVRDRVEKLAPFLDYDGDPYPVVVDRRVQWVIDAYTSTNQYPYAQSIGNVQLTRSTGLARDANYVRNSVKATVDAYTGDVKFYVLDGDDPIISAWQGAFSDMFTPVEEMPNELREHLRYPEDLFRVQTELYSKYQISAENFFQRTGAWSVSQAPSVQPRAFTDGVGSTDSAGSGEFATELNTERFVPYYTLMRNPSTGENEFVILRPYVPFSTDDGRTELQAYITASSDPDSYGRLTTYLVDQEPLPAGPYRVATQAESEQLISREITLQDNEESGTDVLFGDMQIVPVADGLVYVRPFYVAIDGITEYRFVIVSNENRATFAGTMSEALADLFPGFDLDLPERSDTEETTSASDAPASDDGSSTDDASDDPAESTTDEPTLTVPDSPDERASTAELLLQAESLFAEADQLLRDGDLGGYQETIVRAEAFVQAALESLTADG
ncbi:MAG: UPF0182 family protein [Ilumatobacteraceae bacterium]|nr:UPF0182 family protein [Ilumatobacteraceae bacterium]